MYTIFLQYSQTQRADSLMAVRETFGHFVYTKQIVHEHISRTTDTDEPDDCARIKKFLSIFFYFFFFFINVILWWSRDLYFFFIVSRD